jgi:acyl dehydratase
MGLYFEDVNLNEVHRTKARTVTEADLVNFLGVSGINEEHYLSAPYAEQHSIFHRRFVPGALTFSIAEGLAIQTGLFEHTGLALLEVRMRFTGPVFLNDTIHVEMAATEVRESRNQSRGIATFEHEVKKDSGEVVMEMVKVRMLQRRDMEANPSG